MAQKSSRGTKSRGNTSRRRARRSTVSTPKQIPAPEKQGSPSSAHGVPSRLPVYAIVLLLLLLSLSALVVYLMQASPEQGGKKTDAKVAAQALKEASEAFSALQSSGIIVDSSSPLVSSVGDTYLVRFPVLSKNFTYFDVTLNSNLSVIYLGLDGSKEDPRAFVLKYKELTPLQKCAKMFNEREVIPNIIAKWYNGTARLTFILTPARILTCNGQNYTYSLEIGDGYVKTTLYSGNQGHYFVSGFNKGIVEKGVSIPSTDLERGVFLYATRIEPYKLSFSYELINNGSMRYDKYDPSLEEEYNITSVPRLVWNCKYVLGRTLATAELNGSVEKGRELGVLKTLTCIYNNGIPRDLCSSIGITPSLNHTIQSTIPIEYFFSMYQTYNPPCKPDNETTLLQVFHSPDSIASRDQRPIIEELKREFGKHLKVEYYCVALKPQDVEVCKNLINARIPS